MSAVKAYLSNLNGEMPDMLALRNLGVPLKRAVAICKERHGEAEKTAADIAPQAKIIPPQPVPRPVAPPAAKPMGIVGTDIPAIRALAVEPAPAAPEEPEAGWVAMNKLHELSIAVDSGYSSPDALINVGFSKACAEEVSRAINAARGGNITAHRIEATAAAVAERINRVIANRKELAS